MLSGRGGGECSNVLVQSQHIHVRGTRLTAKFSHGGINNVLRAVDIRVLIVKVCGDLMTTTDETTFWQNGPS